MDKFLKWMRNLKCSGEKKKRTHARTEDETSESEEEATGEEIIIRVPPDASQQLLRVSHTSTLESMESEEDHDSIGSIVAKSAEPSPSDNSLDLLTEEPGVSAPGTSIRVTYAESDPVRERLRSSTKGSRSSPVSIRMHEDSSLLIRTMNLSSPSDESNISVLNDVLNEMVEDMDAVETTTSTAKTSSMGAEELEGEGESHTHRLVVSHYSDSLIKLKLREDMHENSCTQWFALKSQLQLEAYAQARRMAKEKPENLSPTLLAQQAFQSEQSIYHQRGTLRLSQVSPEQLLSSEILETPAPQVVEASAPRTTCKTCHGPSEVIAAASEPSQDKVSSPPPQIKALDSAAPSEISIDFGSESSSSSSNESLLSGSSGNESPEGSTSSLGSIESNLSNRSITDEDAYANPLIPKAPLMVETGSEEFVLELQALKPSSQLLQVHRSSMSRHSSIPNFLLKWNFLRFTDVLPFRVSIASRTVGLHVTRTYNFRITVGMYLYLTKCPMAIELYQIGEDSETLLGKCGLRVGRCFRDTNKPHEMVLELNNRDLCLCVKSLRRMHLGYLVCVGTVRGEQAAIEACKPPRPKMKPIVPIIDTLDSTAEVAAAAALNDAHLVSDAELQAFQDGLNLVLVRNKALHTTQEEISSELKERTTWMHEELKWRLTLQENAILCGRDPNAVKWRQWKDDTTSNVRYRPISDAGHFKDGSCHIEIDVIELTLLPDCRLMADDGITHLYVEFAFLNSDPDAHMETMARRKPLHDRSVRFRFTKVFDLHVGDANAALLAEMIRSNEAITFTLVSQPMELSDELQSCTDCGVAQLMLFELLQSRDNVAVERLPVYDAYQKDVLIGELKVRFVGVLAMRSMALHILTPQSFKIIR